MPRSHCPRCESLSAVSSGAKQLFLWPPLGHTAAKLKSAAASITDTSTAQNCISLRLQQTTLARLLNEFRDALTLGEQTDTFCLVHTGDGEPTLEDFADVMTLRKLIALNGADWLIDVIGSGRLGTYFQPIVCATTPHIPFAHECLLRWREPDGGWMPPLQLIETAREADLLFQLDRQARETNIRNAASHNLSSKIFVNFMPTAIYDPRNCLRATMDVIREVGIAPTDVVFEVVETERIDDSDHLKSIMDYYKSHGFGVALDDLGSGYSTLQLLATLRPNYVKLDMEMVSDVHKERFKSELVMRIIELAHQFDIEVIAEGVEIDADAAWLRSQGVDYMQGYYFAKPGPRPLLEIERRNSLQL